MATFPGAAPTEQLTVVRPPATAIKGVDAAANNTGADQESCVQCDRCGKWRELADVDGLPDKWFCELNADGRYSSCDDVEQEWSNDDDEQIGAPPAAYFELQSASVHHGRMPAVGEKRALDQTADSSDSAATGRNDIGASTGASSSGTAAASPPSPPAKKRHRTKVAAAGQSPTLTATDVMDHWLADARLPSDLRYVHDVNAIF